MPKKKMSPGTEDEVTMWKRRTAELERQAAVDRATIAALKEALTIATRRQDNQNY